MEEQEQYYNEVADQVGVHSATQQGNLVANQNRQMEYQMEESEKNLAETQLDVNETLNKIYHLLKQDILKVNENGILDWSPIGDKQKRVLTDEGVDRIMQVMQSYINKETLLSNFDDVMIKRRMLEFSLAINSLMFLKYETYFRTPSMEECKSILKEQIQNKINLEKNKCEILEMEFNEAEVKRKILEIIEPRIEYELDKIKSEQSEINLREYEMIFVQLTALVEATHNRAWKGEERGSLRRHFNISEVIGGKNQAPEKKGWFGFK